MVAEEELYYDTPRRAKMSKSLANEIKQLAEGIDKYTDRIILEDLHGNKFQVTKVRVLGIKTDDPGIVLKLEVVN